MKCSCTLNCRGLYSAFPPAKLQIPAHLALPALAVCLTCLRATTHPVLRGEKGDPLRFKPLITPVGQTKQGLMGKRSWKGAELHGEEPDHAHSSHTIPPALERWDWNLLCNQTPPTLVQPCGFLLTNQQSSSRQCSQLPGQEHLTPGFMGVRVKWLSNSKLKEFHQKRWRTDLLPLPAFSSESRRSWPTSMTLEMHWDIQKVVICLLQLTRKLLRTPKTMLDRHPNEKISAWHNSVQFWTW